MIRGAVFMIATIALMIATDSNGQSSGVAHQMMSDVMRSAAQDEYRRSGASADQYARSAAQEQQQQYARSAAQDEYRRSGASSDQYARSADQDQQQRSGVSDQLARSDMYGQQRSGMPSAAAQAYAQARRANWQDQDLDQ